MTKPTVRLHPDDDIVVALKLLSLGTRVEGVDIRQDIPAGHKVATRTINPGEPVKKYGQIIGYSSALIHAGEHVHIHNLAFRPHAGPPNLESLVPQDGLDLESQSLTFSGFDRGDGSYGTRNFLVVLTSVNCSATAARRIADHFTGEALTPFGNVDGVVAFTHSSGCAMDPNGIGYANLQRTLWGYASHPNCGGVLMVGLGCETNQINDLLDRYELRDSPRFRSINIQDKGGLRKTITSGIDMVAEMLPETNRATRQNCPLSGLTLALQCGGSDAWSGVTANPALGNAADKLIAQGGTAVLAETPEIYGAEHLLLSRVRDASVADSLVERIRWWENHVAINDGSMDNNPSHGNKRGGLTTILEKSLGAVAKAGTSPLEAVYPYAGKIRHKGLIMMDSPGYDPASITGQIAAGCNLVAFTTGRGSVFGSKPAPCIKIATNSEMYRRMEEDMDINAGRILDGESDISDVGDEILALLIAVASGKPSLSEAQGLGDLEFIPWHVGAVM